MESKEVLFKKAEDLYFRHSKTRYIPAIKAFQTLLNAYPDHVEGWSMMATMQAELEEYDAAFYSIQQAVNLAPTDKNLWCHQITLLNTFYFGIYSQPYYITNLIDIAKRKLSIYSFDSPTALYEKIIVCISAYLSLVPEIKKETDIHYFTYQKLKARLLRKLEKYDEAIVQLENCLAMVAKLKKGKRSIAMLYIQMYHVYVAQGKYEAALASFEKANKASPTNLLLKVKVLQQLGRKQLVKETLNRYIDNANQKLITEPETAYVYQKISAYTLIKDFEKARQALKELDQFKPHTNYALNTIAKRERKINRAEALYSANPNNIPHFDLLQTRIITKEEKLQIRSFDNCGIEFITWFNPDFKELVNEEIILTSINKSILAAKKGFDFPVAEYNNLRDVSKIIGFAYGEMLAHTFQWNWYHINEPEKGIHGFILVSPNKTVGILTEELIYQAIQYDQSIIGCTRLYQNILAGKYNHLSAKEFKIIGHWEGLVLPDLS